ncbi:MAG: glycosyl hydrolase family 18 protein [Rikenellaceae bacterium]
MKSITNIIIYSAAVVALVACAQQVDKTAVEGYVTHSTYSVPGRFNSENITSSQNYEDFEFLYLMAMPKWEVEDFDLSQEEINRKCVEDFDYLTDNRKGMSQVPELIENIHKTECKILCSFPGQEYDVIAADEQRRVKFARMMAALVEKFNYDGIELDWEGTITESLHLAFMSDIREALDALGSSKYLYLTTALNSSHSYSQDMAEELSAVVDWINIMTYDMGGGFWTKQSVSYNTPLDSMEEIIEGRWSVFAPEKLCIGLANYGYGYNDIEPGAQLPEGFDLEQNYFTVQYFEVASFLADGWVEQWDEVARSSYFFSPDGSDFFSMDTPRAIDHKLDWVYERGYRGVFWWEYHMDIDPETKDELKATHLLIDEATKNIKEYNSKLNKL